MNTLVEPMCAALALPLFEHPILEEVTWRRPIEDLINRELFALTGADLVNLEASRHGVGLSVSTTMAAAFTLAPMILTGLRFESPAPELAAPPFAAPPYIVWQAGTHVLLREPVTRQIQTWRVQATFIPVETKLSIVLGTRPSTAKKMDEGRTLRIMIFGYEVPNALVSSISDLPEIRVIPRA